MCHKCDNSYRHDDRTTMAAWIGFVLALLSFISWAGVRFYESRQFDDKVGYLVEEAVMSPTIETAIPTYDRAIKTIEEYGYTSGYTSIWWKSPADDIGYWYENLKSARAELAKYQNSPTVQGFDERQLLERLQERVCQAYFSCAPEGISVFPHNTAFAWWGASSFFGMAILPLIASLGTYIVSCSLEHRRNHPKKTQSR